MRQNLWPLIWIALAVAVGIAIAPHLLWIIAAIGVAAVLFVVLGVLNIIWRFITGQKL